MAHPPGARPDPNGPLVYHIRIQGHLASHWADWLGGLSLTLEENGETLVFGPVADQAALHGLLRKVRDSGLTLLSIVHVDSGADAPRTSQRKEQE